MGLTCGPSSAEQDAAGQEASLADSLQQNYTQRFQAQNQVLQQLNQTLTPIVAAGPNQQGFSAQELASMNTQALDTTGAAARNATQAAQTSLAGRGGGGTSGLESGIDKQIAGSIASSEAGNLANTQNEITQANYATGRQNFNTALSGYNSLAGLENPTGYAQLAGSTGQNAFQDASAVSQQNNAKSADILGAVTGGLGSALSFVSGGIGNLGGAGSGSSFGEVGNFFGGGFNALAGG